MPGLKSLVISSKRPCAVFCGEGRFRLEGGSRTVIPAAPDSELFLTVWGEGEGIQVPSLVYIRLEKGEAVRSNMPVIDWGDVLELSAEPVSIPTEPQGRPRLLDAAEAVFGGRSVKAELFEERGLFVALTPQGRSPASFALGEGRGGSLSVLDVGRERLLVVKTETGRGERLVVMSFEAEILLDAEGDRAAVMDGRPTVIDRLGTVRGHERRTVYEFTGGRPVKLPEEIGFFEGAERIPASDAERALSIAEDVSLGTERWRELISPELAAGLGGNEMKEFLGDFSAARLYPLEEPEGRATVGLTDGKGPVMRPRRLVFTFSKGLVADVEEF